MAFLPEEGVEFERRLRRIEDRLPTLGQANPTISEAAVVVVATPGAPPTISGLSIKKNIGVLIFKWANPAIEDLKFFEVQISLSSDLANAVTFRTRETFFHYEEALPNTTYFIAVRAVNIQDVSGPLSEVLNSNTELVRTRGFVAHAIGNMKTFDTSAFAFPSPFPFLNIEVQLLTGAFDRPTEPNSQVLIFWTGQMFYPQPSFIRSLPQIRLYRNRTGLLNTWDYPEVILHPPDINPQFALFRGFYQFFIYLMFRDNSPGENPSYDFRLIHLNNGNAIGPLSPVGFLTQQLQLLELKR